MNVVEIEDEGDEVEIFEIIKLQVKADIPIRYKWDPSKFRSTRKVQKRPNSLQEWMNYSNGQHGKREPKKINESYFQRLLYIQKSEQAIEIEKLYFLVQKIAIFNLKTEGVMNKKIRPMLETALHFFLSDFQKWCCSTGFFNHSLLYQDQYTEENLNNHKKLLIEILNEAILWVRSFNDLKNKY